MRRHLRCLAAGACVLLFGGCDQGFFVEPANAPSPVAVGIEVSYSSAEAGNRGGLAEALSRADRIRVRLASASGSVAVDTTLVLPAAGEQPTLALEIRLTGAAVTATLTLEVIASGNVIFDGQTTVALERGRAAQARVQLRPVPAAIALSEPLGTLSALGDSLRLRGAVVLATGDTIPDAALTWESLDASIATVTADGLAVAVAEGSARAVARHLALEGRAPVEVRILVREVTLSPASLDLHEGEIGILTAAALDARRNPVSREVAWLSSNPAVAFVDDAGRVEARAVGIAAVTASANEISSAPAVVTVTPTPVATVQVSPDPVAVLAGQSRPLQAIARGADGVELPGRVAVWSSADPSIAEVDARGILTGHAVGLTTVTATVGGVSGQARIVVDAPGIELSRHAVEFSVRAGSPLPPAQEVGVTNPGRGTLSALRVRVDAGGGIEWLQASLAGTVAPTALSLRPLTTALSPGTYPATVIVSSAAPGVTDRSLEVQLTVLAPILVSVDPAEASVAATESVRLAATVTGTSNTAVTWTSSATGVAAVDGAGRVTGIAPGSSVIRATSQADPARFAEAVVSVTPGPAIALETESVGFQSVAGQPDPAPRAVAVSNSGGGTLTGLATAIAYGAEQPAGWLTAALAGGSAPTSLLLTAVPGERELAPGRYTAAVTISSSLPGAEPRVIEVSLTVAPPVAIRVDPGSAVFEAIEGDSDPPAQELAVTNSGGGTLSGLSTPVEYVGETGGWLAASLSATTAPATLVLRATPGSAELAPGVYAARITVSSSSPGVVPVVVEVSLNHVARPTIALEPASVGFESTSGSAAPPGREVLLTNAGGGSIDGLTTSIRYGDEEPSGWLTATLAGTAAPTTLTLIADPGEAGLTAGSYSATVTVSSSTPRVADRSVTVELTILPPPTFTLVVAGSGRGAGTITIVPSGASAGLECGHDPSGEGSPPSDCEATFDAGTELSLSAAAAEGDLFEAWTGDCSGSGGDGDPTCTLLMDADRSVGAVFRQTFVVEVVANDTASGFGTVTSTPAGIACDIESGDWSGDCQMVALDGEQVELSARATEGSTFNGWGGACGGNGACVVLADDAPRVEASFSAIPSVESSASFRAAYYTAGAAPEGGSAGLDFGVELSATPVDGAVEYRIDRAVGTSDEFGTLATVPAGAKGLLYFDDTVDEITGYRYRVRACTTTGCSLPAGSEVFLPPYPSRLVRDAVEPNGFRLFWEIDSGGPIARHRLVRSYSNDGPLVTEVVGAAISGEATSFLDDGSETDAPPESGIPYTYVLETCATIGGGEETEVCSVFENRTVEDFGT